MNETVPVSLAPDPVIEEYKKHVDISLLRQNLRRTVQERVDMLMAMHRLRAAAQEARGRRSS